MSKSKIYGVRVGRHPGVYTTWEQCKEQIDGYTGAKYKSFPREQYAAAHRYAYPPVTAPFAGLAITAGRVAIDAMRAQQAQVAAQWQDIQLCPPAPFKPVNVAYEDEAGMIRLWPFVVSRTPSMKWEQHGTEELPSDITDRFRYYHDLPEIPSK